MLSVVIASVTYKLCGPSVVMLSVVRLNVVRLNVVRLSVTAPFHGHVYTTTS